MKDLFNIGNDKDKVVKEVFETIKTFKMVSSGDRVLLSISGGPDSTFLAHVFYLLVPVFKLTLYGFCLDHMTRSGESSKDVLFVESLCRRLKIKLIKQKIDVEKWCRSNKFSFQEGARRLRILELCKVSEKYNIDRIATGHNEDDNIETFLMRLIRGSGARGLAGIKPLSGKFARPLINTSRENILTYLNKEGITYCIDRTNLENIYFRNKIRNKLIPFITKNFLEKFKDNVTRSIKLIRDEDDFLKNYSNVLLKEITGFRQNRHKGAVVFLEIPVKEINDMPRAIKRRVMLSAIEKVKGDLEDITFKNIEDILKLIAAGSGGESKEMMPTSKIKIYKTGEYVYFFNIDNIDLMPLELKSILNRTEKPQSPLEISIGKTMELKDFNLKLESKIIDPEKEKINFKDSGNREAWLDYGKINFPLKIRKWTRGDRFYPLGLKKEKKLHDFFMDIKIPMHLRKEVPIFCDSEKIVWIGNHRIDERVKITGRTTRALYLKLFE